MPIVAVLGDVSLEPAALAQQLLSGHGERAADHSRGGDVGGLDAPQRRGGQDVLGMLRSCPESLAGPPPRPQPAAAD